MPWEGEMVGRVSTTYWQKVQRFSAFCLSEADLHPQWYPQGLDAYVFHDASFTSSCVQRECESPGYIHGKIQAILVRARSARIDQAILSL